ncbi:MAG: sigma-70 family RNA polymerase sigma factor [Chthoniobacterales bacterium]|nr:sigma-70 family RNA polymerase sigma factor [Chthoniobacterales bacterium]
MDGFGDDAGSREDDNALLVALMQRTREDDEAAFRELVEATEDRVFGTIVKMLGGREGAEDLAQRVYLRIWQARKRYEPTAKFSTWMFSITRRLVLNERRARARRGAVFSEPSADLPSREAVGGSSPSAEAGAAELAHAIDAALSQLPEEQRTAMILRRYDEMPYEDIASVLETTVPAVKSLLFRARETLRVKLASWL